MHRPLRTTLIAATFALAALPAAAEIYTVSLRNGAAFQTRHQPQAAPWDAKKVLLLTDVGNWISLKQSDVASVTTDTENKGFGRVLNTTTVVLGLAPNDLEEPNAKNQAAAQQSQAEAPRSYDIDQFVEPNSSTGGLPVTTALSPTYPTGGGAMSAPAPTTPAPPSGTEISEPSSPPNNANQ